MLHTLCRIHGGKNRKTCTVSSIVPPSTRLSPSPLFTIDAQSAFEENVFPAPRLSSVVGILKGDLHFPQKVPLASSIGKIPRDIPFFFNFPPLYAHTSGDTVQIKLHWTRTKSYFTELEAPILNCYKWEISKSEIIISNNINKEKTILLKITFLFI